MTKVKELPVDIVPIDSLNLWEGNPRINAAAIPAVRRSIEYFGFTNPILARREDRMVIAGHTRIASLRDMGEDTAPVIFLDLSEADAKLLNITDNQTGQIAGWDDGKLSEAMGDLGDLGMDLELTGFDVGRIRELTREGAGGDEFDVEAVLAGDGGRVERGQVWACGDHRVMCGDATVAEDVVRLMAGEEADALITDPPYGVRYDPRDQFVHGHRGNRADGPMPNDDGSLDLSFLHAFEHRLVWGFPHVASGNAAGWLVWDKHPGLNGESIGNPVEMAATTLWSGFRIIRLLWGGYYRAAGEERGMHPTQKPVGVIAPFIEEVGLRILDLFLGSGTTMIAAERLGRRCYGMEIEPRYVDVALARWEAETGQQAVLDAAGVIA